MLKTETRLDHWHDPQVELTLPFDLRQRSRFRAVLSDGGELAVLMPRGTVLRGGDLLRLSDGRVAIVQAASEPVTTAFSRDPRTLARAAYHLGNRHVQLQVGDTWLRYLADHVLDEMAEALDLRVFQEHAPFEPETGAYGSKPPMLANVFQGQGADRGAHHHEHQPHRHGHDHAHE